MPPAVAGTTHLHDLPDAILTNIFSLVHHLRSRNSMSLVCRKWLSLERTTRTSLSLRGNSDHLFLLPTSFSAITNLDLSLLYPWGHPPAPDLSLVALRLRQAFPNLTSLTLYARIPSAVEALAPQWGEQLRAVRLVRWHQRPHHLPHGGDLAPLLAACPRLHSLDLSQFYCWTEDIPAALQAYPVAAASLIHLNLLSAAFSDGYRAAELLSISSSCPNLREFLAPCVFNPRYIGFVGDETLLSLATNCPRLKLLHLADPAAFSPATAPAINLDSEGFAPEDARITCNGLEKLFSALPLLEDLGLDLSQNVRDSGPAFEELCCKCPKIKSLKLGMFHSVCRAAGLHLDGVAVCGGLTSLCISNSADLSDASLRTIARGCRRLSNFEIHACRNVTEIGIKKLAASLRMSLVQVSISGCLQFDVTSVLRALEPIRDRIEHLHIDCIRWVQFPGKEDIEGGETSQEEEDDDDDDVDDLGTPIESKNKRRKCSVEAEDDEFWFKTWGRLKYLSLWFPAGEVLTPLAEAGMKFCPELEEMCIKVEGDCRVCLKPAQRVFGLNSLARYPRLSNMKLDCGEAIGYALTAPSGHMDLSWWERFYLHGIGELNLYELNYWPPQDKDVNQRTLSLPAAGLLQGCTTLRKLFIHGTAHEHFMGFFLQMPNLRDVQLREDYYPAPENDMSTEMRVDSCSRFKAALNQRYIPD
ncbi:putative leucine-rich repeat domain superfamily, F-box-like domain superfamily [Dioscorea sansibarensis]